MNYARTHHLPVKVYCPFVQTWLKKASGANGYCSETGMMPLYNMEPG